METISHIPRKHKRHKLANTFVVNNEGVCRVFDLSSGGISFGCTSERTIPDTWVLDIIDDTGVHLPNLPIRTVWTAKNQDMNTASIYEIVIGAEFSKDLSSEEKSAIDQLFCVS